jgi:hypothetical protein
MRVIKSRNLKGRDHMGDLGVNKWEDNIKMKLTGTV